MFSKSNLISTLVTAIWANLGGWLLWGIIMDPMLQEHNSVSEIMREMPDMLHLVIGCLIVGFAFSTIYRKWGQDGYTPRNGLNFGVWIGILIGLGDGIIDFSVMEMLDITGTLLNGVTYIVFYAIMGALAGIVYQKTSPV